MRSRLWIKRMIFMLSLLMMLGFGKTLTVEAVETSKEENKLTEEYLTGTWICSEGFVCDYSSNVFIDPSGMVYMKCKINNGVVTGTTIMDETVSTKIVIVDKDTIQVEGYTAVRAESKLGKEYQAQFSNLLIGKWLNFDRNPELSFEFKKDNSMIVSDNEADKLSYELVAGGIKFFNSENAKEDKEDKVNDILYFRIHEDTLSFCYMSEELKFYREGSEAITAAQNGKAEITGEWIFSSENGKLISQWKIDSSDKLTIDYFSEEKDIQQAFSTSRKDYFIMISMGGKTFQLNRRSSSDNTISYHVSQDLEGILVKKDSEEGKYYIKKAKTIYQAGKEIQRTQYKKFNDDFYPEVTAISVSARCMSNLWLDDFLRIITRDSSINDFPGICGQSYEIVCDTMLKNAKIVFSYDESQLPYAYEKDLVIVRLDEKTGKQTVLKTTRNLKSNKVTAKIKKDGIYYLADSVVINGGTRDITKRNPKTTEWAKSEDTGDILSLIDLKYIKKSNGYFKVSTVSELASVVYYVNTTPDAVTDVILEKDIDLSGYKWAPMGWSSFFGESGYGYQGIFKGNNHTIRNLYIDNNGSSVGFLGWAPCSSVYNLNITNAKVNGGSDVGILAGQSIEGYYENCHVDGVVDGSEAGSLVGYDAHSKFVKCSADVIVNGSKFNFLSWNEKEISEIVVKDYITITVDDTYTVTRPEVTGYDNLTWSVDYNGSNELDSDAENHTTFQYYLSDPGNYTVYLTAYIQGQYVRVSNEIKYRIE